MVRGINLVEGVAFLQQPKNRRHRFETTVSSGKPIEAAIRATRSAGFHDNRAPHDRNYRVSPCDGYLDYAMSVGGTRLRTAVRPAKRLDTLPLEIYTKLAKQRPSACRPPGTFPDGGTAVPFPGIC